MRAIHHIAIICSDYARSRAFYRDILQLPVIREVWRAERQSWKCDLDAGNAQIELFSFPDPPARTLTDCRSNCMSNQRPDRRYLAKRRKKLSAFQVGRAAPLATRSVTAVT